MEPLVEHKIKVSSSSLEFMDLTSLQLIELAPNPLPLDQINITICDHFLDASKSLMLGILDHMIADNNFDLISMLRL